MPKRNPAKISQSARTLVQQLKAEGVPSNMISPSLIRKRLGLSGVRNKNLIGRLVFRLQKRGELQLLSTEEHDRLKREARRKGRETRWIKPAKPEDAINRFRGRARSVCRHIVTNLARFRELPSEDVSSMAFSELNGKIFGLIMTDVSGVVRRLRKLDILPAIPEEVRAKLNSIKGRKGAMVAWGANRKAGRKAGKVSRKKLAEFKRRAKAAAVVIDAFRKQTALLKGIGNETVFFDILHELMVGSKPEEIVKSLRGKQKLAIDAVDIACVAHHSEILIDRLNSQAIKDRLRETAFWNTYSEECRETLKKYCISGDKFASVVIKTRLKWLGRKLSK